MAYALSMWAPSDVSFEVLDDGTDDPVVTIAVATPLGELLIMAQASEEDAGRTLRLQRAHVQSKAKANTFGVRRLRLIAEAAMEQVGYEQIIVEGAPRTTGANPGHRPRYWFARRSRAAAES